MWLAHTGFRPSRAGVDRRCLNGDHELLLGMIEKFPAPSIHIDTISAAGVNFTDEFSGFTTFGLFHQVCH